MKSETRSVSQIRWYRIAPRSIELVSATPYYCARDMRIILSRKGFDASTGKRPSLITHKGELISLPIPDRLNAQHNTTYRKIVTPIGLLGAVLPAIKARTKGKTSQLLTGNELADLDPDL